MGNGTATQVFVLGRRISGLSPEETLRHEPSAQQKPRGARADPPCRQQRFPNSFSSAPLHPFLGNGEREGESDLKRRGVLYVEHSLDAGIGGVI